jgi:hypothetical protein
MTLRLESVKERAKARWFKNCRALTFLALCDGRVTAFHLFRQTRGPGGQKNPDPSPVRAKDLLQRSGAAARRRLPG